METLVLTLDTIALMAVIYFSFKSEKSPDKPELGPFRIKVDTPASQTATKQPAGKRVIPHRTIRGL